VSGQAGRDEETAVPDLFHDRSGLSQEHLEGALEVGALHDDERAVAETLVGHERCARPVVAHEKSRRDPDNPAGNLRNPRAQIVMEIMTVVNCVPLLPHEGDRRGRRPLPSG
jgi:hypothetical protein